MMGASWESLVSVIKFIGDVPLFTYYWFISVVKICRRSIAPKKSLDGETILITGASTGIGHDVACQLASETKNLTLVLWDINEAGLVETAEKCSNLGAKVYPYRVDLSNREEVINMTHKVRDEVGCITTLINNAGIVVDSPFLEVDPYLEEKTINVNFMSHLWIIREFLPDMIMRGRGHLVSTISGLAFYRWRNISSYVASKYALRGFFETLKLELKNHPKKPDIKISAVYPGWVKTPMTTDSIFWKPRYNFDFVKPMESAHVAKKIIEGIQMEMEEIVIPRSIKTLGTLYRIFPTQFFDAVEKIIYKEPPSSGDRLKNEKAFKD